ncbi:MAG: ribonuclease HIII [Planctomycetota bacterium]
MSHETRVLQLAPESAELLGQRLSAGGFIFRAVPYAKYSYSKSGIVTTYYNSEKLVLQGSDLDIFVEQYLSDLNAHIKKTIPDDERIGSDEAGKGDYFGPLVVAAAFVAKSEIARLRKIGVTDSKQLSDETIARLAGALESSVPHSIIVMNPAEYNERHRAVGNVNKMLGELHGQAIINILPQTDCRRVLTDQFGDISYVRAGLGQYAKEIELKVAPRAEEHVAVAAASILARNAFVEGIKKCSDDCGIDLPKGAGDPVEKIIPKVAAVLGRDNLKNIAKVHFKTTEKILDRLF